MTTERLMAELDGARFVKYDPDGYLFAWHGGHGVHVYNAAGTEVYYFTVGDQSQREADPGEIEAAITRHMMSAEWPPADND